jgi:PQQ-dependent dehydrogenase (s-GDH family)
MLTLVIPITLFAPGIQPVAAQIDGNSSMLSNSTTLAQVANATGLPTQEGFSAEVLATNFSSPHNIIYGPDGVLWITERVGKSITRVDPNSGDILSNMSIPEVYQSGGQDGLMGMVFDPDFNNTRQLYVAYTYDAGSGEELDRRTKIVRFTYDQETATISNNTDLITGLSGSVDHKSGRMVFGPDGKLYYTIGDQGKNQFSRYCEPIRAQILPTAEQVASRNWTAYEGKVLRINPDGSIPDDNPEIQGVQSHIFTYGHRNAQGIELGPTGDLYVSEHGDKTDDEFSRLESGANYGWPNVAGYIDGQAYQYANWSGAENCMELKFNNIPPFPPSVPVMNESEFDAQDFVPPIQTFYTVDNDFNFTHPPDCGYVCWPTVAPSSLRLYSHDDIPEWNGTFLMPTLKAGRIIHLDLNENGTALAPGSCIWARRPYDLRDYGFFRSRAID